MLTTKTVAYNNASYTFVKDLYHQAFPEVERIPFPLLLLRAKAKWIDFIAFYDHDQFCGFVYLMNGKTITNIMYLAVAPQLRSHGYGQQILTLLKNRYPYKTLVLEIESPDNTAINYEQQISRKAFYIRNGFMESGYDVHIYYVDYEVMKSRSFFRHNEWTALTKRLSFGFVKIRLHQYR